MFATAAPAPALPAVKVQSAWVASAHATRVVALSLRGVPPAAHVVLRCGGGGCPFQTKAVATHGGAARVAHERLPARPAARRRPPGPPRQRLDRGPGGAL